MIILNVLFWPVLYLLACIAVRLIPVSSYKTNKGVFRELGFEKKSDLYAKIKVEGWSRAVAPLTWFGGYKKAHFYQTVTIKNAGRLSRDACMMESFHWFTLAGGCACFIFTPPAPAAILFAVNTAVSLAGIVCMRFFRMRFRKIKELLMHIEQMNAEKSAQEAENAKKQRAEHHDR